MSRARAVVVAGPPASGKTTLAQALARSLGFAIVDLDIATRPLTRVALELMGLDEDAVDNDAGASLRQARYDTLLDVAAANLAVGRGVVLAAPFTRELGSAELWGGVVRRLLTGEPVHAALTLIVMRAPASVLRARMAARGAPRDRRKLSQTSYFGDLATTTTTNAAARFIDATQSPATQLRAALAAVSAGATDHEPGMAASPC